MLDLQLLLDLGIIKSSLPLWSPTDGCSEARIAIFFWGGIQPTSSNSWTNIQYGLQNWCLMLAIPPKKSQCSLNVHQHQPTLTRELIGPSGRLSPSRHLLPSAGPPRSAHTSSAGSRWPADTTSRITLYQAMECWWEKTTGWCGEKPGSHENKPKIFLCELCKPSKMS